MREGHRDLGFIDFEGVRQKAVKSVEEAVGKDHLLLDEETERTDVYGRVRPPVDLRLRSGMVGVFMVGMNVA